MLSAAPRVDIGRETLGYQCSPGGRIESWPALFSIRWDLPPDYHTPTVEESIHQQFKP